MLSYLLNYKNKSFKQNCQNFHEDLIKSINENTTIYGTLKQSNFSQPEYFNFFHCDEYVENISKYKIDKLTFTPLDIEYPYNKYYSISSFDNKVTIKFAD